MARTPIPWGRLAAEFVVIVVGVLVALAADAWWQQRGDGQRRSALLDAIQSDMARAHDEVERVARHHTAGLESAAVLLERGDADLRDHPAAFDSLLSLAWASAATYDAPLGAVEAVIRSGSLDLLSDDALVFDLTAFPSLVSRQVRQEQVLTQAHVDFADYLGSVGIDVSHLTGWAEVPWERQPTSACVLVNEVCFRGFLNDFWHWYYNSLTNLQAMRETIERVQARLAR
jgi:hypothetical protein